VIGSNAGPLFLFSTNPDFLTCISIALTIGFPVQLDGRSRLRGDHVADMNMQFYCFVAVVVVAVVKV